MKALLEFDEKEFWIQLFSVVARREERTEGEDIACQGASEMMLGQKERLGVATRLSSPKPRHAIPGNGV
jgi:hypothetical protein